MTQHPGTNGGPTSSGRSVLSDLVAECLARIERDGEVAIDLVCREHPEHAAALRRRLSLLRGAGVLETQPAPPPAEEFPQRLGEFRILERIGSGGMGVVFLAEQESLKRRLALKVIRPEHLFFPGSRERFRREVETVARLQHPGIVPVYTVGEDGGVPYLTMEWVAGVSLAELLRALRGIAPRRLTGKHLRRVLAEARGETRTAAPPPELEGNWVDVSLRIVVQAAMALDHAHRNGVLHRDVKPSNLMLTDAGRVVLLDFGLATAEGATKLTRAGSDLGSLPYMAPEQLRGEWDSVDERTDVYALGVTLYEMLTLREAFLAETTEGTRARVLAGAPAPIHSLNRAVPWDAATVCMKAMDADPARRYATAAEFARDLRNVLELQPIMAERPGPVLRTRLWVRRHPAQSLAVLLAFLLVVVGPIAFGFQRWAAAEEIGAALRRAQTEQRTKERVFGKAVEAVDRFLARVTEETLVREPHDQALRHNLVRDAVAFYEELLREEGPGTLLRHDGARMAARLGSMLARLEATEPAEASLRKAVESYGRLVKEDPADRKARRGFAAAKASLALLLERTSRVATGEALFREALAELTAELAVTPDDLELLRLEARVGTCLGVNLMRGDRHAEAEQVLAPLVARLEPSAAPAYRADPYLRSSLAEATRALGQLMVVTQRLDAAEPLLEKSLELHRSLLSERATKDDAEPAVARTLLRLAELRWRQQRIPEAEPGFREGLALIDAQLAHSPLRGDLLSDRATGRRSLGEMLIMSARLEDAEVELRAAQAAWQQLVDKTPSAQAYLGNLAGTEASLAWALAARGMPQDAVELGRRAVERLRKLIEAMPDSSTLRGERAQASYFLGGFLDQIGETAAAVAAHEQAVADQLLRLVREPRTKRFFAPLAAYTEALATLTLETGGPDSLAECADRLAALDPTGAEGPRLAVTLLARCARSARATDEGQERSYADRAMQHLADAVRRGFKDRADLEADPSLRALRRRADYLSTVSGPNLQDSR